MNRNILWVKIRSLQEVSLLLYSCSLLFYPFYLKSLLFHSPSHRQKSYISDPEGAFSYILPRDFVGELRFGWLVDHLLQWSESTLRLLLRETIRNLQLCPIWEKIEVIGWVIWRWNMIGIEIILNSLNVFDANQNRDFWELWCLKLKTWRLKVRKSPNISHTISLIYGRRRLLQRTTRAVGKTSKLSLVDKNFRVHPLASMYLGRKAWWRRQLKYKKNLMGYV